MKKQAKQLGASSPSPSSSSLVSLPSCSLAARFDGSETADEGLQRRIAELEDALADVELENEGWRDRASKRRWWRFIYFRWSLRVGETGVWARTISSSNDAHDEYDFRRLLMVQIGDWKLERRWIRVLNETRYCLVGGRRDDVQMQTEAIERLEELARARRATSWYLEESGEW